MKVFLALFLSVLLVIPVLSMPASRTTNTKQTVSNDDPICTGLCGIIFGWLVSKGLDYASAKYQAQCAVHPESDYCMQGAPPGGTGEGDGMGGGGGDGIGCTIDVQSCTGDYGDDGPGAIPPDNP